MLRSVVPLRTAFVVCLAVLVTLPMVAVAQQEDEERLSEARAEIQRIAEEIEAAEEDLEDVESELEDADERLAEIEAVVNEVASDVERQRSAVGDAQQRVAAVEREADELGAAFEDRVARLYKQGPELTFETFMSSEGSDEAIARTVLLERVTEGDQVDLERLDAAAVAVEAERGRLQDEQDELEALLDEQQAVLVEVEELRESRALEAASRRAELEELGEEHDDLESEEAELEELIRQRQEEERRRAAEQRAAEERAAAQRAAEERAAEERAADRRAEERRAEERPAEQSSSGQDEPGQGSSSTSSSDAAPSGGGGGGGGYAWPMCAPVTSEYGPRWGRTHRGIDQGAAPGTPIGASRAGTVIFAGWQGGYGNLTLIDHGGGVVTAYAHQTSHAVGSGTSVSQGQTIGYVGSTGNSTGPHLHFEIRVNGTAVNPRQYLSGSPC